MVASGIISRFGRRPGGQIETLNANARVTAPGRFRFTLTGLLSIGGLATALSLSKSGLFAHFGSKEALQVAVL